ncbi:hypothetical protein IFT74_05300 [Oxalobacteraceae sp. CFBP 8755]|nr:hypothetical protein [Oxalobacteraceae sp. CFBP 8755]
MADPTIATAFMDIKASDLLKFLSEFITAIAWPMAAGFIVNLFRKEIIERIPRLAELTLPGGLSARFNEGLAKVEAELEVSNPTNGETNSEVTHQLPTPAPTTEPIENNLSGSNSEQSNASAVTVPPDHVALKANPAGVVMEAWQRLDQILRLLASQAFNLPTKNLPTSYVVANLRSNGYMSHEEETLLLELIKLRDLAAHSSSKSINSREAKRFVSVADNLRRKFTAKMMEFSVRRNAARSKGIQTPQS